MPATETAAVERPDYDPVALAESLAMAAACSSDDVTVLDLRVH